MLHPNEHLLLWWGQGKLQRFIGGKLERRVRYRSGKEIIIKGILAQIIPSVNQEWKFILISEVAYPPQKLRPLDWDFDGFDRNGCLVFRKKIRASGHKIDQIITLDPFPGWRNWTFFMAGIKRTRRRRSFT